MRTTSASPRSTGGRRPDRREPHRSTRRSSSGLCARPAARDAVRPRGPVLAVALSPDGELVASAASTARSGSGAAATATGCGYTRATPAPVWSVAFSPDGQTLLSGGADGLVLTYDLRARRSKANRRQAARSARRGAAGEGSRGAELFRKCAACHTVTPDGEHRAGPTLYRPVRPHRRQPARLPLLGALRAERSGVDRGDRERGCSRSGPRSWCPAPRCRSSACPTPPIGR